MTQKDPYAAYHTTMMRTIERNMQDTDDALTALLMFKQENTDTNNDTNNHLAAAIQSLREIIKRTDANTPALAVPAHLRNALHV